MSGRHEAGDPALHRGAEAWVRIAFGLAAVSWLVVLVPLALLGFPLLVPAGLVFGLLAWPLVARTNRGVIMAELVSWGVLVSACSVLGFRYSPEKPFLPLVPFVPAICAALAAVAEAAWALRQERVSRSVPGR